MKQAGDPVRPVRSAIVDENYAENTVILRDVKDLVFETRDNAEYLRANDLVYIREDAIPALTAEPLSCEIGADGYARYYSVAASAAGKTMAVQMPEGAAYAVYDENDTCIDFSTVGHLPPAFSRCLGACALSGVI